MSNTESLEDACKIGNNCKFYFKRGKKYRYKYVLLKIQQRRTLVRNCP